MRAERLDGPSLADTQSIRSQPSKSPTVRRQNQEEIDLDRRW
jgi:hypothetical protein